MRDKSTTNALKGHDVKAQGAALGERDFVER
jgi:hypothetical protein